MRNPLKAFELNISSIKELHQLHSVFQLSLPALDLSEVLRAEYVLIVSALDCYLHDIVRINMKKMVFDSISINRLPSNFKSYNIPLGSAKLLIDAKTDDEKEVIISQALRDTLYKFSFESEQTIEKAMSYIGVKKIWSNLTAPMEMTTEDIKRQLTSVY